ncbi:hypothetical protein BsWGS_17885 [Bradybaena similaris]
MPMKSGFQSLTAFSLSARLQDCICLCLVPSLQLVQLRSLQPTLLQSQLLGVMGTYHIPLYHFMVGACERYSPMLSNSLWQYLNARKTFVYRSGHRQHKLDTGMSDQASVGKPQRLVTHPCMCLYVCACRTNEHIVSKLNENLYTMFSIQN